MDQALPRHTGSFQTLKGSLQTFPEKWTFFTSQGFKPSKDRYKPCPDFLFFLSSPQVSNPQRIATNFDGGVSPKIEFSSFKPSKDRYKQPRR